MMDKCCGTCARWNSGEVAKAGSLTIRSADPTCKMTGKTRYAEHEKGCFAWREADIWDLVLRKRAGLIEGDYE